MSRFNIYDSESEEFDESSNSEESSSSEDEYISNTWEVIKLKDNPVSEIWQFPLMYRIGAHGALGSWQIGFDGEELIIKKGTENSSNMMRIEIELNNSGKSLQEQALMEAKNRFRKKLNNGYSSEGSNLSNGLKAMKGFLYEDGKNVHENIKLIGRKCDGYRGIGKLKKCTEKMEKSKVTIDSFDNMDDWNHLFHIEDDIKTFSLFLPEGFILDGEIYIHGKDRFEISSILTTRKTRHEDVHKLKYYLFDLLWKDNRPAEERYDMLRKCYKNCKRHGYSIDSIKIVKNYVVCTAEQMIEYKDKFILEGYEGAFARYTSRKFDEVFKCSFSRFMDNIDDYDQYEDETKENYKRSLYGTKGGRKCGLKFKNFKEEEMTIVGVKEAKGTERGLSVLIVEDDYYNVKTNIRWGKQAERRRWLHNPQVVIDRRVTIRYDCRTKDNKLIHPRCAGFRKLKNDK